VRPDNREEINIASSSEISMAEVLGIVKKIMSRDAETVSDQQRKRPGKSEVFRLYGDNSLITSLTDWRPEYSIEDGLRETVTWFMESRNLNKYKSDIYNL